MLEIKLYPACLPSIIPQDIKDAAWIDEDGEDYRTVLVVKHNEEIILIETDEGEPEDNSFGRDWNWVPRAIQRAYDLGVEDGKKDA